MSAFLIILAVVLLFIILFQIGKVVEVIGHLRGEKAAEEDESNDLNAALISIAGIVILVSSIISVFFYQDKFLPTSASTQGIKIDQIRNVTLLFTGIVYIITQTLLIVFVWKYRYKKSRKAVFFPHNNTLELVWTVIPSIVLVILVVWGLTIWYQIFGKSSPDAIVIEATAQQFRWNIRYPGADNQFGIRDLKFVDNTNELGINWGEASSHDDILATDIYLPVNRDVKVNIRSLDVLHNFYLPHFRMKMDAVPGIPTSFWFTPIYTTEEMRKKTGNPDFNYELACAELCGSAHYNMRKKVVIVTQEEYDKWLLEQQPYYKQVVEPTLNSTADSGVISADSSVAAADTVSIVEDTVETVLN
jgi:cytochrome c oxidase subunit 2